MFFLLVIPALFFISCTKNSTDEVTEPSPDFVQLRVGNYWVYEFYKVDSIGVEKKLDETDSSYILKDTLISGIKYFVRISNPVQLTKSGRFGFSSDTAFLRDSSGYLLRRDPYGRTYIFFSRDNFTDVLYSDTIGNLLLEKRIMTGKDSTVSVPAGSFITRSFCLVCYPLQPYPYGIRKYYYIYGENTGLVKYTYGFFSSPDHYEARLARYKRK